jgi:hypothetical protein
MDSRENDIRKELREIAPDLAEMGKINPYFVEESFFNSLTESILTHIKLFQLKDKRALYFIPNEYFESLAESIIDNIRYENSKKEIAKELSEIAPLLNSVNKANVFSVPEHYFESIILGGELEKKPGKIISLGGTIRKWMTYAAAASVLLVITTTSYLYVTIHGRSVEKHLPVEQRIAELNEEEILDYLHDNDGITSGDLIPAVNEDPQIQHMLQRVSDEEIENYLEDYGDTNEKPIKGI